MIGTIIGSYRIDREIGEGGMSRVYVGKTIIPAAEVLPAAANTRFFSRSSLHVAQGHSSRRYPKS